MVSLTAMGCFAFAADTRDRPPNVVFILADDSGFSDLGCYGGEIETPNLDALADDGLRFTQFYNTARCWPTRASLMTGYYAQQVRRDKLPGLGGGNRGVRPDWAPMIPAYLRRAGYRNYHSGKWHLDGKCLDAGFDRSFNVRNQGNFFSNQGNSIDDVKIVPKGDDAGFYTTTATADHAIDCLKDHAQRFADQPFFHYIAFISPHFPLHALPEDIQKYKGRYDDGWDVMRRKRYQLQRSMGLVNTTLSELEPDVGPPYHFPDAMKKLGPGEINRPLPWVDLNKAQQSFQATKMAIHAAMVDRMDQEIGRVIDQLKAMGEFQNTLIFYASDNGASAEIMVRNGGHDPSAPPGSAASYLCLGPGFSSACNTPFRRHKTWVHEGGCASPLVVHWPAGFSGRGEMRRAPAHMVDILPTILDVAGVSKPNVWNGQAVPPAPGKSLVDVFAKDQGIDREYLWWSHEGNRAIRVGDWKLVASKGAAWSLYDLSVDRAESNDLASTMPGKVRELALLWTKTQEEMITLVRQ
ncbi:MAG: arylsulfatase [Planctomycetota bacterium]